MINADEIAGILKQQIERSRPSSKKTRSAPSSRSARTSRASTACAAYARRSWSSFPTGCKASRSTSKRTTSASSSWAPTRTSKKATRCAAPAASRRFRSARRCSDASSIRSGSRSTAKGQIETDALSHDREHRADGRPAPAGQTAAADRHPRDRRAHPDRQGPARADHRRPVDRQNGDRDRHDHQPKRAQRLLHLRRDRSEELDRRRARADRSSRRARWSTRRSSRSARRKPRRCAGSRRLPAARWAKS